MILCQRFGWKDIQINQKEMIKTLTSPRLRYQTSNAATSAVMQPCADFLKKLTKEQRRIVLYECCFYCDCVLPDLLSKCLKMEGIEKDEIEETNV